jgi:quinohemoprotein ethanol dehydrogenase
MPLLLADLRLGGVTRKVLMHAPKNGFFYVLDRNGKGLISAQKYTKVTWAERIDVESGRPVELRNASPVWPSVFGGHSWQPMSFNPMTQLVYLPTMKLSMSFTRIDPDDGTGALLAWDPVSQKKRWEVKYADSPWNGGTMTTAGNLVFHGTGRGRLGAYDAGTGKQLWSFDAGLGIVGTPISYEVEGAQFISVLVGYGGSTSGFLSKLADYGWRYNEQPRRLLTFALGQKTQLPPSSPPRYQVRALDDPTFQIDAREAAQGEKMYHAEAAFCVMCHGRHLENTGSFAPDLRESAVAMNWEAFRSVVRDGVLSERGMPKFDTMGEQEMRAIYMYIRQRAREASEAQKAAP